MRPSTVPLCSTGIADMTRTRVEALRRSGSRRMVAMVAMSARNVECWKEIRTRHS